MAKDYNRLKMENDRVKKNLYEKSLEMDSLKIAIKSFDSREREYEKKIIELQNEINRYKEENRSEIFKREIRALRKTINEYKARTAMLQEKLDLANKQIGKYTFDDTTQYIKEQDKLIKALRTEIQGNKLTILQLKNTISMYDTDVRSMTISRLLDELWGRLRYRNLRYFDWKFDRLMKGIIKFRKNQRDFRRTEKAEEIAITEEYCSYGYIIEWDFELVFMDINGNKYELLMMPHNIRDIIEMPVKAVIREGRALILSTYDYADEQAEDSINVQGKSSEKAPDFNNELQPFNRPFIVLIVGSNGKCKHYKNFLQSLGIDVITYDSFEENPQRLKDEYSKADIVIVCTSHIRHFVLNIIDVHENKVTQIEKDSVVTIYARTRFMAVQLGFI